MWENIETAAQYIQERTQHFKPEKGIILGTGLGAVTESMDIHWTIPYTDIPGFPTSTVQSHSGQLLLGFLNETPVVVMQGRIHYYEGYTLQEVVFPIRTMGLLGIHTLLVTNAAGGLAPAMETGEIMLITDHINLLGISPLMGANDEKYGPRFPDMMEPYAPELCAIARKKAIELGIRLHEGVYAVVSGPSLETPAEYRYIRTIGADAVGMSTVPEVIACVHMGIKCLGLSAITDLGVPGKIKKTELKDVLAAAGRAGHQMATLIQALV
jgi:purine-nucleoside phosphorylase